MKTKIKHWLSFERVVALAVLGILVALSMAGVSGAQAVVQGYAADHSLERGLIVQIRESDTTKIEPVTRETADQAHGVVVAPNDAPVTISAEGQKVFVATTGKYAVLVSDENGPIEPGSFVTISSLSGIGMRVDDQMPIVIGRALDGFDGSEGVIGTTKVGERTVNMGRITVDIGIAQNPLQRPEDSSLPDFLKKAAEDIAGKPVDAVRVYLGLVVFFVSTIVAGSLMYSGVRSGIISIGRNPLSKKSIIRGMFQVIIVGLTIFLTGIFGVYLLLRL